MYQQKFPKFISEQFEGPLIVLVDVAVLLHGLLSHCDATFEIYLRYVFSLLLLEKRCPLPRVFPQTTPYFFEKYLHQNLRI
jgi:hypothetical protein